MNIQNALACIADVFQEPLEKITPETPREEIPAWDSLGVLTLIAVMDETFDILLEDEQIEKLETVGDIINILIDNNRLN